MEATLLTARSLTARPCAIFERNGHCTEGHDTDVKHRKPCELEVQPCNSDMCHEGGTRRRPSSFYRLELQCTPHAAETRDPRRCGTVAAFFTKSRTRFPQQSVQMLLPAKSCAPKKRVQVGPSTLADGHEAGREICQRSARWAVQGAGRTCRCHRLQAPRTCDTCRVSLQLLPGVTPWIAIVKHRDGHCHE